MTEKIKASHAAFKRPAAIRNRVKGEKYAFARQLRSNPTHTEQLLWQCLKGRQLGFKFRRQSIILGWIVDFYCPETGLIVELDGSSHNARKEQDARRDNVMRSAGFEVLRFSNNEVIAQADTVISRIQAVCEVRL